MWVMEKALFLEHQTSRGDNVNFVFQIEIIKGFVAWDKKIAFQAPQTIHFYVM